MGGVVSLDVSLGVHRADHYEDVFTHAI